MGNKKRIMLSIDEGLLERLENACEATGVSKSAYISTVIAKDLGDTEMVVSVFRKELEKIVKEAGLDVQ